MTDKRVIGLRTGKTVFRADDKVVKMFDTNYSKSDILNEALNQARIEEIDLNIPKILEVTKLDGKWAIIQENIQGRTLEYLIKMQPEKTDEYIKQMVQLQFDMHKKKPPLLNKLKDTLVRKIADCELNATLRYDIIADVEKMPKGYSLCHGDFDPSNIVLAENDEYYILDFSHSTVGNSLADVAKTYILLIMNYDEKMAEKYLQYYCEKAIIEKQNVIAWLKMVAAAHLTYAKEDQKAVLFKIIKS